MLPLIFADRWEVVTPAAETAQKLVGLDYFVLYSLKSMVAKYGSQFRGNSQHDALEFLLWLLDRVHEDANPSPNNNNNTNSSSKTKATAKSWKSPKKRFFSAGVLELVLLESETIVVLEFGGSASTPRVFVGR
ncbi:Ubiquitin carboxyl-terminal hydrolase 43 [Liparis tanakae]|uniref:Ubiquitin carboxyl-terminal hydrolase 43 n=1 Tax=Liparis tanakae TaxID=230148 RepID=A0A4Z2GNM3_9TELE|nr:Ubiquitin carboxyl-terminal hydrolase 43 [Liparis tanakae]